MAAVLACGRPSEAEGSLSVLDHWGAALSHRSAAELWGLLDPSAGAVHISVLGTNGRGRRAGIHIHRSRSLSEREVTARHGIPITTPIRTIADLRAERTRRRPGAISAKVLRQAIRQAEVFGFPTGAEHLTEGSRSDLELDFLALCRRHRLPEPEVNVWVGPHRVDFLWRSQRLIVETDGYRYHRGPLAFDADRDRDLTLRSLGYEVLRLSERQVANEPDRIASALAASLTQGNPGRGMDAPPRARAPRS
jgi:very-short-patch-repair endonuclease